MTGKPTPYRYALILVTAVSASLLLALSWPRLRASLMYLPVDTALSNFRVDLEFDSSQLDGLVARATESIAIHDHYRYLDGLSELKILTGQDMSRSLWDRRQALEDSISVAGEVIQKSPTQPRTWFRIARAKAFMAYPTEQVITAFKMSILTGRYEPKLMLIRLKLGLLYLQQLDMDTRRLLRDQAVLTWTTQKQPMLNLIKSGDLSFELVSEVLSSRNQAIISEIEAHLK